MNKIFYHYRMMFDRGYEKQCQQFNHHRQMTSDRFFGYFLCLRSLTE